MFFRRSFATAQDDTHCMNIICYKKPAMLAFLLILSTFSPPLHAGKKAAPLTDEAIIAEIKTIIKSTATKDEKPVFMELVGEFEKKSTYKKSGTDEQKRPALVGFQAIIEKLVTKLQKANPDLSTLAFFLTPAPMTPLCADPNTVTPGLIDKKIEADKAIKKSVLNRTRTVRSMLDAGTDVYAVFPAKGLLTRTKEQQKIYNSALSKYNKNLNSNPVTAAKINEAFVGGVYLFPDARGETVAFFIQASQANKPSSKPWVVGLGPLADKKIKKRVEAVANYLAKLGEDGPKKKLENL